MKLKIIKKRLCFGRVNLALYSLRDLIERMLTQLRMLLRPNLSLFHFKCKAFPSPDQESRIHPFRCWSLFLFADF